jgi:hypothetical protein
MPPEKLQYIQLERIAKSLIKKFKQEEAAEASFISTAHFSGFSPDVIYQVAADIWPGGYAAKKSNGNWCFGS